MGKYYGRVTKAVGYMAMAKVAINSPILSKDDWYRTIVCLGKILGEVGL